VALVIGTPAQMESQDPTTFLDSYRRPQRPSEDVAAAPADKPAKGAPAVKSARGAGAVKLADGATQIMGGAFDPQFQDEAPKGGVLIGFEVGLGKFVNSDVVRAIRPIYRTAQGDVPGKQYGTDTSRVVEIKARPGYAVGAITAKAGLTVDGFSVTFMRSGPSGLSVNDSYESEWVGGMGGGRKTVLGGTGTPVVGIVGKSNAKDCTGLGLLLKARP
jgi:hypothetical protein